MAKLLLLTTLVLFLSSCGSIPSFLSGGGTNVAANTQVGKENTQNLGYVTNLRPVSRVDGPVGTVVQDTSTTKNTEVDPLLLLLLILGWLAPSPSEIGRNLLKIFRRS